LGLTGNFQPEDSTSFATDLEMTITLTGEAKALCIWAHVLADFSHHAATHAGELRFSR
jgi:hypothetical protein